MKHSVIIVLAISILSGCSELRAGHRSQVYTQYLWALHTITGQCEPQPIKNRDYLFKVCEYVLEKQLKVTSRPNTWTVAKISDETINGKDFLAVHFSCCGPGDVAFFDKTNGELCCYERKPW